MVDVTRDQISRLVSSPKTEYLDTLTNVDAQSIFARYGISDKGLRLAHFFAQVLTETGGLHTLIESLDYSASRMTEVWPKHFPTVESAAPYAHNEEKLGNFIYGQILGQRLGNIQPGDGFKYRGRGLIQLTGRDAYKRFGDKLEIALVDNPNLAFDGRYGLSLAALEWSTSGFHGRSCNELADDDNLEGVTYAINGGQTGIADRRIWLKQTKTVWMPGSGFVAGASFASRALANLDIPETAETADFPERLVGLAETEWATFGNQQYDLQGHATKIGHKEGEDPWYLRVGDYWRVGVDNPNLNGRNTEVPWSAAFISWCMRTAGAASRFAYNAQHSIYIYKAKTDLLQGRKTAGYWCYPLKAWKPRAGDLVCWSRRAGIDYQNQNGGDYPGHCDIVVEVKADTVDVIGGNVGNSVTRRPLGLDASGYLLPNNEGGELLFGVMRCLIDEATDTPEAVS